MGFSYRYLFLLTQWVGTEADPYEIFCAVGADLRVSPKEVLDNKTIVTSNFYKPYIYLFVLSFHCIIVGAFWITQLFVT